MNVPTTWSTSPSVNMPRMRSKLSRLLKMQLKWHWLRVGVVYEFTALPTLPFGSLLSFKRLLRSTWAT